MTTAFKYLSMVKAIPSHCNRYTIAKWFGVLCIGLMLFICTYPVEQGWSHTDIFFNHAILTVLAIGVACCFISKAKLKVSIIDGLILMLYAYFMARYYLDDTYPAYSTAIQATYAISLYFALRLVFSSTEINGNVIAGMILLFSSYEAFFGLYQAITGTSRHNLYLATGSFNNPGPYSACLVMGLVVTCVWITKPAQFDFSGMSVKITKHLYILLQLLAIIFACIIILTLSRTAFIAASICLMIVFRSRLGKWIWIAAGLGFAVCVGLYYIKPGSADGRIVINCIGLHAIADSPWLGTGVGSFFHTFANTTEMLASTGTTMNLNSVDVIECAFNDWLHLSIELGITGLFIATAIVTLALWNVWKKSLSLFLILVSILVFSFFSYPLELLPYSVMTIMILSYAASQAYIHLSWQPSKIMSTSLIVVLTLTVFFCMLKKDRDVKAFVKAESDYNMLRGIIDHAFINDYKELRPFLENNRYYLFDYARLLAQEQRYNDSNDMLRRGALISNDPMFIVLQGNNYRDMEAYELAEQAYLQAWHRMPNRIYPLFRLMKLNEQLGNTDKAKDYAGKIIAFNEKIPSPAVNEIKQEAREKINNNNQKKH